MKSIQRVIGGLLAVAALVVVAIVYGTHAVRSSDHQDTFNLANRSNTSADITDVYVFPSPANPANVVLAMDVSPLIPAGMGTAKFFDPTLMWQLKISHQASGIEDQVIQFGVNGTDGNQVVSVYGPAKPNEVGTTNTFVPLTGNVAYNTSATLSNGIQAFAGPRADPFFFDLFAFFSFLGDRNAAAHTSQTDPGTGDAFANSNNVGAGASFATAGSKSANPNMPSFAGFTAGTLSNTGGYACRTDVPAQNALADLGGGFNVLTLVVEVPKTLLTTGFASPVVHVWATTNSSTGS
jgi:Domain of unknown function (DUF4331)